MKSKAKPKSKSREYPCLIREMTKEEGNGYLASFPDLPGCMSDGATIEEAVRNGYDAADGWIEAAKTWGKKIPAPSKRETTYSGKFVVRTPKSLHARLAERAKQESISMNQLALTYISMGLVDDFFDESEHKENRTKKRKSAKKV